jgi:hypothetical protein
MKTFVVAQSDLFSRETVLAEREVAQLDEGDNSIHLASFMETPERRRRQRNSDDLRYTRR